jgi:predicted GNAT family N-acyltransferase
VLKIKIINPGGDYSEAMKVRYTVFVEEQGVPYENEIDEYDKIAYHVVIVMLNGDAPDTPIGCGRIYFKGNAAKLGRVAVLPEHRRKGYAIKICGELINIAASHDINQIILHSQTYAVPVYEKLGFICEGEEFLEEDIRHYKMVLEI